MVNNTFMISAVKTFGGKTTNGVFHVRFSMQTPGSTKILKQYSAFYSKEKKKQSNARALQMENGSFTLLVFLIVEASYDSNGLRTHNHLVRKRTLNELSGCVFESRCSHLFLH